MGWFRKDEDNKDKNPEKVPDAETDIRTQALAHARAARERLGEDTIRKIAEAIQKKQNSPVEKAKAQIAQIAETEANRVAEEILSMLETRH